MQVGGFGMGVGVVLTSELSLIFDAGAVEVLATDTYAAPDSGYSAGALIDATHSLTLDAGCGAALRVRLSMTGGVDGGGVFDEIAPALTVP